MTVTEFPTQPEHKGPSRLRRMAGIGALTVTGALGIGAAHATYDMVSDTPALVQDAGEAVATAVHLAETYDHFISHPEEISIEVDPASGRVEATLPKDAALTLAPIEEAFSRTDETEQDFHRLKLFAEAGAVGLLVTGALQRWDKSIGRRNGGRVSAEMAHMFHEAPWLWSLMLVAGVAYSPLWAGEMKADADKTMANATALLQFDADKAFKLSDDIEQAMQELDVEVEQDEDTDTTKVSFKMDEDALLRVKDSTAGLGSVLPKLNPIENTKEHQLAIPFAGLALIGFAETAAAGHHAVKNRRLRRAIAAGKYEHVTPLPRFSGNRGALERRAAMQNGPATQNKRQSKQRAS